MFYTLERIYNLLYSLFQLLGVVVFFVFLTTYFLHQTPETAISNPTPVALQPMMSTDRLELSKFDMYNFTFDLSADFRPLYHWDTRMLFVWVAAEYSTSKLVRAAN